MTGASRASILDGAVGAALHKSLNQMTVSDVAKSAGVSRATVYRYFEGGRDEIISALVNRELQQFLGSVAAVAERADSLEQMLVDGLMCARRLADEHELLQRELSVEPEAVLPFLTTESRRLLDRIAEYFEGVLRRYGWPEHDTQAKSQYLARLFLSYAEASGSWNLSDADEVVELVRTEFLADLAQSPTEPT